MNINLFNGLATTIFGPTLLGYLSLSVADSPSPLDVNQHPGSPPYESLFPDRVVPLDAELSWTRRFQGDESFNSDETLPPTSPVIDQSSIHSKSQDEGESSSGFDTTGVVKQIKLSEGKVKIEHGPIDRLGMPGMTMMFRAEEPDLLTGIEKGAEVAFNVDNTSSGFTITRLEDSSSNFDTTGIVKQIKSADGKVKIEHGPIDRLGMPGMTMMCRVEDINQLQGLEKGAEVAFNVANTAAGFSITRLKIVDQKSASRFDASGTIKSIRTSQGKVKIEHGPIERLGMPGMTMLFKVKNPAELKALETDMQVDFNVENGSGGFEITAIRPRRAEAFMSGSSATSTQLCYSIGPFKNRASAVEVSSRYQARGSTAKINSRVDREYIGEMVFIDDLGTREAALEIANILKSKGITDSMLLNEPGKTYVYEFELKQSGTFMYHPHADEMVQMAMGMMGSLVVHPRDPNQHRVDRDYCFVMSSYDIEPGTMTARINTMLDFNIWTWNSRVFPGIDHLVCKLGERVRVRIGNLTMTNHPIHIHGLKFEVACTDGGWVPRQARWPEVTVDLAVGQMRAVEFDAEAPGDWAMHCHKSHHTMNPMGHDVPNMIGVDQSRVHKSLGKLLPGYMIMGERGMADMGEMVMPLPSNTLPMMTGQGQFGPIEMGGMFTVLKIRKDMAPNDYSNPGWYDYPLDKVAYEI